MPTAEQLAFSICTERRGVHVLLWDQQEDLVRALMGVFAAFDDMAVEPVLVSDTLDDRQALAALVETRNSAAMEECNPPTDSESVDKRLWILFVRLRPRRARREPL